MYPFSQNMSFGLLTTFLRLEQQPWLLGTLSPKPAIGFMELSVWHAHQQDATVGDLRLSGRESGKPG
jgi:hypothetical protein